MPNELWFVRVPSGHPTLDEGCWLWSPSANNCFGEISDTERATKVLRIHPSSSREANNSSIREFSSLAEVFDYIQAEFLLNVVEVSHDEMPSPDDL